MAGRGERREGGFEPVDGDNALSEDNTFFRRATAAAVAAVAAVAAPRAVRQQAGDWQHVQEWGRAVPVGERQPLLQDQQQGYQGDAPPSHDSLDITPANHRPQYPAPGSNMGQQQQYQPLVLYNGPASRDASNPFAVQRYQGSDFFQLGQPRLRGDNVVTDVHNFFTPFSDWFIWLAAMQFYYVTWSELDEAFRQTESYAHIEALFGCLLQKLANCNIHMTDPTFRKRESMMQVVAVGQLLRKLRRDYLANDEKQRIKKIPRIEALADRCYTSAHATLKALFGEGRRGFLTDTKTPRYADALRIAYTQKAPPKKKGESYVAEDALPLFRADVGTRVMGQVRAGLEARQGALELPIFGPQWKKLFSILFKQNAVDTQRSRSHASPLQQCIPDELFALTMTVAFGQTDLSNLNRAITGMLKALLDTANNQATSGGLKEVCMHHLIPAVLNGFLAMTRVYTRTDAQAASVRGELVTTANSFFHARKPTGPFSCCKVDPRDQRVALIRDKGSFYLFLENALKKADGDVGAISHAVKHGMKN